MKVIKLTDDIYVNPNEISAMQFDTFGYYGDEFGTTITLQNGRKILVKGLKPDEIIKLIKNELTKTIAIPEVKLLKSSVKEEFLLLDPLSIE